MLPASRLLPFPWVPASPRGPPRARHAETPPRASPRGLPPTCPALRVSSEAEGASSSQFWKLFLWTLSGFVSLCILVVFGIGLARHAGTPGLASPSPDRSFPLPGASSRERSSVQSCSSVTRPPAPSVLQVQKFLPMPPFWATFSISLGRANISRVFLRTLRVHVSQVTYSAGSVNRSCLPHWVVSLWSGCLSSNVSRGGDAVSAGHSLCPVCRGRSVHRGRL